MMDEKYILKFIPTKITFDQNPEENHLKIGIDVGNGSIGYQEQFLDIFNANDSNQIGFNQDQSFDFVCQYAVDRRFKLYKVLDDENKLEEIASGKTDYLPEKMNEEQEAIISILGVSLSFYDVILNKLVKIADLQIKFCQLNYN